MSRKPVTMLSVVMVSGLAGSWLSAGKPPGVRRRMLRARRMCRWMLFAALRWDGSRLLRS